MLFKDIIGQDEIKNKLIQSVKDNRISHAQLFLGPEGCGNLALAIAYAQFINCEDKQGNDACGACASCIKMAKLTHPDVHFSFPVVPKKAGKKPVSNDYINEFRETILNNPYQNSYNWLQFINAENKQGNITVLECHEIIKKTSLKAYEADYKIVIIWMPEFLGLAGNSLLKVIEEPTDNTLYLLVAENQELILNTILSRTQLLRIQKISDEAIAKALAEKEQIPEERALHISYLADGNYLEALRLTKANAQDHELMVKDWLNCCYQNNGLTMNEWVDKTASIGRENQKNFIRYLIFLFRECMILQYTGSCSHKLSDSEKSLVEKLIKFFKLNQIDNFVELLNAAYYHIERNANPKLLFFKLSIEMNRRFSKKQVAV